MVTLKAKLQSHSYFLFLLPLFFIIHGYNDYFGFFPIPFVLFNLLIIFITALVLYILSLMLLKNKQKSSLHAFWILLVVLTFGSIHDLIIKFTGRGFFSSYTFILPLLFILFICVFFILLKTTLVYKRSFLFLNLLFFTFILFELGDSIQNFVQQNKGANLLDNQFTAYKNYHPQTTVPDSLKPDIYFLVFDGMPSTKAMNEHWGFNNSSIDSFLLKENFYISKNSKSNYNLTVLSISSTFNMHYAPAIDIHQDEIKMYFRASASILNNSLLKILHKEGYHISHYQPVSFINTDWKEKRTFEDMLYMNYFYRTLPGRIYRDLGWLISTIKIKPVQHYVFSKYKKQTDEAETTLHNTMLMVKESCKKEKKTPQFLYAHFQTPHEPYLFDSIGNRKPLLSAVSLKEADEPQAFIEQVKFTNKLIQSLVLYIKKYNKKNTVVIIEGDHGFRNIHGKKGYMIFENLNSIYVPDADYQACYDSMSPVNSFRFVLNKYYSANLPLLKDSSIFIPYTLPGKKAVH